MNTLILLKKCKFHIQFRVENGDIVKIYPGKKPEVYDKAPSGRLYVDGNIPVEEDSKSIKERKNLSSNGYMEVTILVTPKGNIHKQPILSFKGLPIIDTEEFILWTRRRNRKHFKYFFFK